MMPFPSGSTPPPVSARCRRLTPARHRRPGIVGPGRPRPSWRDTRRGKDHGQIMRVLVAEDFEVLAEAIGTGLRREGMAVDVVLDGNAALEHLAVTRYDVVVLDRDLPGVHGDEVCRQAGRRAVAEPDPDADRGQHGQGPGGRPRPGRRRLPAQAVRLRRAGRPGPRPGPPHAPRRCPPRWGAAT